MTNSNQTPVGFTPNAFEYFKTFYKRATGNDLTNDQVTTWFDDISHFQPDGFFQWKYKTGDSPRTGREIALYGLWWLPLRVRANCVVNEIQRYLYVKLESLSGNNAQYQLSSL